MIDATLRLIEEEGWQGVTLKAVSASAGVSTGIIAHYFGHKDALILAATRAAYQRFWDDVLSVADAGAPASWRVNGLVERLLVPGNKAVPDWAFWLSLWGQMPVHDGLRAELVDVYRVYTEVVADVVRAGQNEGSLRVDLDPLATAEAFVALADGIGLRRAIDPERMPTERMRALLEVFWRERSTSPAAA